MGSHAIWLVLTVACIAWYATVTVYVAIRGVLDIRTMLRKLKATGASE